MLATELPHLPPGVPGDQVVLSRQPALRVHTLGLPLHTACRYIYVVELENEGYPKVREDFTCPITEKAPSRPFSWLKVSTSAFTYEKLLIHFLNG